MGFDPRYHEQVRARQSVVLTINKHWGKATDETLEMIETWDWMCKRATEEGIDLQSVPTTPGHIRISVSYIKLAIDDTSDGVKPSELRKMAKANYAEFLSWTDSKLGKFCLRLEEVIEKGRIRSGYRKVRRRLETLIDNGDKKAIEMWFRINGKYDGQDDPIGSDPVEVVESYVDTAEGVLENKKVIALPTEALKPRSHGNVKSLAPMEVKDVEAEMGTS